MVHHKLYWNADLWWSVSLLTPMKWAVYRWFKHMLMNELKTGTIEAFEPDRIISRDLTLSVCSRNRSFESGYICWKTIKLLYNSVIFQSVVNKTIINTNKYKWYPSLQLCLLFPLCVGNCFIKHYNFRTATKHFHKKYSLIF